ncbi:hypothetical protein Purlil1_12919 [Purpureocillium lilacinum]|uniref:Cytochrome P450 n=1 Tax=Purpureocillium lilacinum TaxID=33203 RepID=A0ABR0BFJ1_PURLI|nr:hypothetical protein Purlil1_12919 [Purpureocillium lilacinum]
MTAHLIVLLPLILCCWWLYRNVWIFPSRHYHGEDRGCGRINMLPTNWMLPFGLDKLVKILNAEKHRKLPVLSLKDHERYGDTYGQYAGGLYTIVTRDSRNISTLLSKQFHNFGYGHLRKLCFGPLLGEGIFTEDGAEWRASRRLLASVLSNPRSSALQTLESHFQDLQRRLVSYHDASTVIDLRPLFYDYTLDTATDLFLGNSTNILRLPSKVQNEGTRFSKAFNEAVRWLATRERFKMFAWLVTTPALLRSCGAARESLENMIIEAQCLETSTGKADFTDFLGKTTDLGKARDELMNLLFAARDSNASLLCWLVYALAREPEVFERVKQEIRSVLGNDKDVLPTGSDLARLRYLDDVVHETLRLFPAVPINGRLCRETTTLPSGGGESGEEPILVPRGALVAFSTYACQRSIKYYGDDAMKFRPERWQKITAKTRTRDFTFHPFIGGPRKCLGERFALQLAKYTICRLAQCFKTITVDVPGLQAGPDWQSRIRYQIGLTMAPDEGNKAHPLGNSL